ncbi:serine aminopeptidase domain-containing protein [Azospirillum agricola]|uniref:serine aminopeptidase domain-containing protein n=1 Tax=Azospirillum agricola TaxID=1720247 RepID=UPI000A0F3120|nr:alpha/beta hydrolase [Azospirillum agricola]SMH40324.1 Lysophospholipase, alpha-beta hydrolase superfamily [Azospirillum lipoferum]
MTPTPVVFEGCFGWLHPADGRRGVVLCGPHGHEELCVHRAWMGLAQTLAAAGLPTLRFDYHGLGDSAGEDSDPGRVRAWLDSVRAAVRRLREDTGVTEVALVGYRLGGLLALVAAEEMAGEMVGEAGGETVGVDLLALVAPTASGRMAVREMQALSRIVALPGPEPALPDRAGQVNVVGFALTPETALELAALDARPAGRVPARHALLLDKADSRVAAQLAATLGGLGVAVERAVFAGTPELVQQPQRLEAAAAFAPLTAWLTAGGVRRGASAPPERPAGLMMPNAVERPVVLDGSPPLFGVHCAPVLADPSSRRPAILFLNSGATHHVGSGRATVLQARRLAALGHASLRIDAAGLGDSPARPGQPDNLLYNRDVMTDVRAALDWLEEQGHERCVIVGLCAGGAPALLAGLGDERVAGQILLNPGRFELGKGIPVTEVLRSVAHRSTGGYLREAFKPAKLRALLRNRGRIGGLGRRLAARLARKALIKSGLDSRVLRVFRRLSAEGRRVLLVYSVGDMTYAEFELHLGLAGRCLNGLPGIRVEYLERADHSLTDWSARERLDRLIDRHLESLDRADVDAPVPTGVSVRVSMC